MRTEITQEIADLIGRFQGFDPYVGKLVNENYSMSIETYIQFKDTDQFKQIDWSTYTWKDTTEFNFYSESK